MGGPLDALLRHHVTGAIERGEAQAIAGQPVNVIIRGSWGDITVERATGNIVEYDDHGKQGWDPGDVGYHDIARFLPETLAPGLDACLDRHGETDILCVGYITTSGAVEMPEPDYVKGDA